MKCGKCGQNEANYYYRETVNGVTKEIRLCADCAREEGLEDRFARHFDFGRSFGFADSFFEDFFAFPVRQRAAVSGKKREESACSAELQQRRERNMLEQQLKDAVEREDYESAITLRDRLKEMK